MLLLWSGWCLSGFVALSFIAGVSCWGRYRTFLVGCGAPLALYLLRMFVYGFRTLLPPPVSPLVAFLKESGGSFCPIRAQPFHERLPSIVYLRGVWYETEGTQPLRGPFRFRNICEYLQSLLMRPRMYPPPTIRSLQACAVAVPPYPGFLVPFVFPCYGKSSSVLNAGAM